MKTFKSIIVGILALLYIIAFFAYAIFGLLAMGDMGSNSLLALGIYVIGYFYGFVLIHKYGEQWDKTLDKWIKGF